MFKQQFKLPLWLANIFQLYIDTFISFSHLSVRFSWQFILSHDSNCFYIFFFIIFKKLFKIWLDHLCSFIITKYQFFLV